MDCTRTMYRKGLLCESHLVGGAGKVTLHSNLVSILKLISVQA